MYIEKYIELYPVFSDALLQLHEFFLEMGLEPKTKFKLPFYYGNTWICYLNIPKSKKKGKPYLELCFVRGVELESAHQLLDFSSRAMIAGLKIYEGQALNWNTIRTVTEEAIDLDRTTPYTFKKKNKK